MITLTEYLNHPEPQTVSKVILTPNDYIRESYTRGRGYMYSFIRIPILEERHNTHTRYIQMNDQLQIWEPHPGTNYPKKATIFFLPEDQRAMHEEIAIYMEFFEKYMEFLAEWQKNNPYNGNLEDHNKRFRQERETFLYENKEKYKLSDEELQKWLTPL